MTARFTLGKTTISQIPRWEVREIFERLKHTPKKTLANLRQQSPTSDKEELE